MKGSLIFPWCLGLKHFYLKSLREQEKLEAAGSAYNMPLPIVALSEFYCYHYSHPQKTKWFWFISSSIPSPPFPISTELNGWCQVRDAYLEWNLVAYQMKIANEGTTLFTHETVLIETNLWQVFCPPGFIIKGLCPHYFLSPPSPLTSLPLLAQSHKKFKRGDDAFHTPVWIQGARKGSSEVPGLGPGKVTK